MSDITLATEGERMTTPVFPVETALRASLDLQAHLDALQDAIGSGNAKRGFHEEGDALRESLDAPESDVVSSDLRNYYITKLALIGTEVSEAIEELRNGRAVDEVWYSAKHSGATYTWAAGEKPDALQYLTGKPEGVPSELADIVIRAFDFADEAGFSIGEAIIEKLSFNATRPFKHGKEV